MNILSLFDGISTGYLALKNIGIKIDNYYSSEIDKYANAVSEYHFPEIIRLGDINNWHNWNIEWDKIDLILAGSPCQGFSIAGKGLNFEDPRSKLFFEFTEILNYIKSKNPKVLFLLENVKMKKEWQTVITNYVKVEPIEINSALLSAQSRKRLYWTNIKNINQPEDKKILLKDIIENGFVDREKSFCLDTNYSKGINVNNYFKKKRRQLVLSPKKIGFIGKDCQKQRIYSTDGKSVTLQANSGCLYVVASKGRNIVNNNKRKETEGSKTKQKHETSFLEKQNCSLTIQKDSLLLAIKNNEVIIRKLYPIECERLQTLPENFTLYGKFEEKIKTISNTQRYKMLGNGWTLKIIEHILKNI